MMNISSRFFSLFFVLAFTGLVACKDSGHSLGSSRDLDAGKGDTPVAAGGSTGASSTPPAAGNSGRGGGSSTIRTGGGAGSGGTTSGTTQTGGGAGSGGSGSTSRGGDSGGTGGRGGASAVSDAGVGDTSTRTCALRGEACDIRPCCGLPLVCMNFTNPPTCYESMRPPVDAGISRDTPVTSDTKCPTCPLMKCAYGSPVDSNGCTLCECNPAPDGGADTTPRCPAGGCIDADLSTPCPSQIPTSGSSCLGQTVCNYEDCPGTGHTQAMCRSDKWVLANGACDSVSCLGAGVGNTCPVNKVCLLHVGGNPQFECIDNPCGSGLVSADCSAVTAGCTPLLSSSSGLTFYCST